MVTYDNGITLKLNKRQAAAFVALANSGLREIMEIPESVRDVELAQVYADNEDLCDNKWGQIQTLITPTPAA